MDSTMKSAIQVRADFSWNVSLNSDSSFGLHYTVPAEKIGYVKFAPYINRTAGTLIKTTVNTNTREITKLYYAAWGHSPKKLPYGFCDGVYVLTF